MRIYFLLLVISAINYSIHAQIPDWVWAKSSIGTGNDEALSITTDLTGNVFVAGNFKSQSITFGSITLTNVGGYDIFVVKYDPLGNVIWATSAGGVGDDYTNSVTTDAAGNCYIAGHFHYISSSITFGNFTFFNAGSSDFFIVKYDASGNVEWAKSDGTSGTDKAHAIKADAAGNIYVTGQYGSDITFGSDTLYYNFCGGSNVFLVKYNSFGNVLWAKSIIGSAGEETDGIATDISGNVYITGKFLGTTDFDPGPNTINLSSVGDRDIFIAKYDDSGNIIWAKSAGGTEEDHSNSIATDQMGNVYITGCFYSYNMLFGNVILPKSGYGSYFIAKYDQIGNLLWAHTAVGSGLETGKSITTDSNGDAIVTGFFMGSNATMNFDPIVLNCTGNTEIFVTKYNGTGIVQWAKSVGGIGAGGLGGEGITADLFNNIYVTGKFTFPSTAFGSTNLVSDGTSDVFVAKLGIITSVENIITPEVSVFPNPVSDFLIINSNISEIGEVRIFDVVGNLIKRVLVKEKEIKIEIKGLDAGVYFVQLNNATIKFVKF